MRSLTPREYLRDFVLDAMTREPIRTQIDILTALAAVEPSAAIQARLRDSAQALRAIAANHQQLLLDLRAQSHAETGDR